MHRTRNVGIMPAVTILTIEANARILSEIAESRIAILETVVLRHNQILIIATAIYRC